jgi:tRNA threonylcarbamoyladenosine biosynthesis protein TsaE
MKIITTDSLKQTQDFAADFAKAFKGGVIALSGRLGSGKTTFTQGFARGLGIKEKIISPTFVLIRQHQIPKKNATLYHIDLYRLNSYQEFRQLGLNELLTTQSNFVIIEWAEKIKKNLPKNTTFIYFETIDQNKRRLKIS